VFGKSEQLAKAIALDAIIQKGWPALHDGGDAHMVVDVIGLELDKDRWVKLRRERTAGAVLDQLAEKNDPVVAKFKAHAKWAEVAPILRAMRTRPALADLRLARQTGDAEAIAKATPVLDDTLVRLDREFDKIAEPGNPTYAEDLAFLDKR
jgi:hypothetical protein